MTPLMGVAGAGRNKGLYSGWIRFVGGITEWGSEDCGI